MRCAARCLGVQQVFALRGLGVGKGDRVVIYLPMIPEAAFAMLACARIGAIHSVVFGGFSPDSLANRINDSDASVVITADFALGYADVGDLWRSRYDLPPEAFVALTDRLWAQVEPLYEQLHCYVRARLHEHYGEAVQPATGPIRADLLGDMWAQEWNNIYNLVEP